ncbi:MAG TPA: alanine--tRNA ligase [Anaerolineales bacterium]|jgi:alanyl-tRNA synthetase|nr:alanine--tRNA ligase [Anaerolineales bacterium]
MTVNLSGNEIRQQFIDFFVEKKGHAYVPSSSLVPAGDATLLFANSGMVQFKDVFLGTDKRDYNRAVNSQKCMRVAGKHNDLEDVGLDDTHHTFFEMLGNWSFGDYYKKEAIEWAWELLTGVWNLPKENLYVTVFKDELGEIPTDDEAAAYWKEQPGLNPDHILYFGRKDNFWEMANTGPCGPNSEIHIDLGPDHGEITYLQDGRPDLDGPRFLELWNLVFMQYNRTGPNSLELLPAMHVDTGMGFDRIVTVLQGKNSNYRTDLFWPVIQKIQQLSGQTDEEREDNFTPYRVVADHARAATFLIADGVIPGNIGRNYVTRMIIRRAARFATKINLNDPFMSHIAEVVIDRYGDAYPELKKNREIILSQLTREEERFQKTVEGGIAQLETIIRDTKTKGLSTIPGKLTFELYATHGLPLEISRDIALENDLKVDEQGFQDAMEAHRLASGGGKAMGELGGEDAEVFQNIFTELQSHDKLPTSGVKYDPYSMLQVDGTVLSIMKNGEGVDSVAPGDQVEIILPETGFYVAAGGQVSDTGSIVSHQNNWEVSVTDTRRPSAGMVAHRGSVVRGNPKVGDAATALVDLQRRQDIMRNHTATHLLHAELERVLGSHAQQAGSLVAPDRLRFDFTHPEALTKEQLAEIEAGVNRHILNNFALKIEHKPLDQAKSEGARALFGEKYGDIVRTIQIGGEQPFSYELCGGTHVGSTGEIGTFLITSEGSVASGIRRIEAVTGSRAYQIVQQRFKEIDQLADLFKTPPDQMVEKAESMLTSLANAQKEIASLRREMAGESFMDQMENARDIKGVRVLTGILPEADRNTLREMTDRFRQKFTTGVAVLAAVIDEKPALIAAITDDLVDKGLKAGDLIQVVSEVVGGSGGGRPNLAQAGGRDASKLEEALEKVPAWVEENLA